MTNTTDRKEKLYKFRGKEFYSNPEVIRYLNYALALNRCKERYEEVKSTTKRSSRKSKKIDSESSASAK